MQYDADKIKSPRKLSKLARKFYRRDMQKSAKDMGKSLGNLMKPKPKYIPWKIWLWMMGFFIKIKK